MIHDAQVEVTCDEKDAGCTENEYVQLEYFPGHGYDATDQQIEEILVKRGWIVRDGKHYCSEGHAQA